jgi:hypothetical protein
MIFKFKKRVKKRATSTVHITRFAIFKPFVDIVTGDIVVAVFQRYTEFSHKITNRLEETRYYVGGNVCREYKQGVENE